LFEERRERVSDEEIDALSKRMWDGDQEAREELIMGLLYIVQTLVGRFLYHWPTTRRLQDEMVSAGLETVIEVVDKHGPEDESLRTKVWVRCRDDIENMINDMRSTFAAPSRTNRRLVEDGEEPVYHFAEEFQDGLDKPSWDQSQEWVDMLDEIDHLGAQEKEQLRYLIQRHLSDREDLDEGELSAEEAAAVDAMASMFENL
jgi:hypothetical protein